MDREYWREKNGRKDVIILKFKTMQFLESHVKYIDKIKFLIFTSDKITLKMDLLFNIIESTQLFIFMK